MKKILILFFIIFSLGYSAKNKIDLYESAKNNELRNQIFLENKIYKVYTKPYVGTAINFREDEILKEVVFGDQLYFGGIVTGNQLIIKPKEYGVSTNLFIKTDRNDYYFDLVSVNENSKTYNPVINFLYPMDMIEKSNYEENNILKLETDIENLNFKYRYKKNYSWSPTQIFDDGKRTYIFLNEKDEDIPSFYIKKDKEMMVVLARVVNSDNGQKVMVIDKIFKEGILGLNKKTITIRNKHYRN